MTPTELYNLMEPCRKAMMKDGIWPSRDGYYIEFVENNWWWVDRFVKCMADDAHNAFLAVLLGWALCTDPGKSSRHIWYCKDGHYHVGHSAEHSQSLLHALVSDYRQAKGIK